MLMTPWGEHLDENCILTEYPRPQMRRNSYLNLNGRWEYAITDSDESPRRWDGTILVPFSPESALSGVGRSLQPGQALWYRREVIVPQGFIPADGRLLLHFGAVDQEAAVYWNGRLLGRHMGGYNAFTLDATDALAESNVLLVAVRDGTDTNELSRGKQKTKRGGIWYTPQSGIWQTVWAEWVPERYISALRITPDAAHSCVRVTVQSEYDGVCYLHFHGRRIGGFTNRETTIRVENAELWSPEHPKLYDFSAELGSDRVESYFALRDTAVGKDSAGRPCLLLNGKPYFHSGVLDQGYYPDGLYTAPSDEAMIYDITLMKRMGFNMLRKHIKVEPMRWYYHCDRLGMLVWQDMVNGGDAYSPLSIYVFSNLGLRVKDDHYRYFSRSDAKGRAHYMEELGQLVELLYNTVSLAMWVPFNEGWGQFDALKAVQAIRRRDATRPIDHASGWHDQGGGDLKSRHVYYRPVRLKNDGRRVLALTEFGGYSLQCPGHLATDKKFGYRMYDDAAAWMDAVEKLYENEVIPLIAAQGLSAAVYTQVSDVEDEVNGLLTFDRRVCKPDAARMQKINEKLHF